MANVIMFQLGGMRSTLGSMIPMLELIPEIKVKVDDLWAMRISNGKLPNTLNEEGLKLLKDPCVDRLVEERYEEILNVVKRTKPGNLFQMQTILIEVIFKFKNRKELELSLEDAAL